MHWFPIHVVFHICTFLPWFQVLAALLFLSSFTSSCQAPKRAKSTRVLVNVPERFLFQMRLFVGVFVPREIFQNFKVFDAWSLIHLSRSHWNRWNHVPILTCFPSHFTLQENADAFSSAAHLYEDCSVLIATVTSNPRIQLMMMMVMVVVVVVVVIMCVGEIWRSGSK